MIHNIKTKYGDKIFVITTGDAISVDIVHAGVDKLISYLTPDDKIKFLKVIDNVKELPNDYQTGFNKLIHMHTREEYTTERYIKNWCMMIIRNYAWLRYDIT